MGAELQNTLCASLCQSQVGKGDYAFETFNKVSFVGTIGEFIKKMNPTAGQSAQGGGFFNTISNIFMPAQYPSNGQQP